jgi:protein gp37
MNKTSIEWTDATWNPVTGCTKVSSGCKNCYAERVFPRAYGKERKFTDVLYHPDRLSQPLRWRKPRRVFVNSMSDLFHEDVGDDLIKEVFTVMAIARNHVFQVLTKRPVRMIDLVSSWGADDMYDYWHAFDGGPREIDAWPLPNVWLGVSCEDQKTADERIPAAIIPLIHAGWNTMLSLEPLLGPIVLRDVPGFNRTNLPISSRLWAIVGGESGPKARPMDIAWARSIVGQCRTAGVPVFYKQGGASNRCPHDAKGGHFECFPPDLQIREFPR